MSKNLTKIIFETNNIEVLARPGSSSYALVTFCPATDLANGKTMWGQRVVDNADITAIGIRAKKSNWFPVNDMMLASSSIKDQLIGYDNIVSYGSSMGGYGALKFGRLLRITHGLSFAPQWSIAPEDVGAWDKRFIHNFDASLHTDVSVKSADLPKKSFVFYDPFMTADKKNVEKIFGSSQAIILIKTYLTEHFPITLFGGTKKVVDLIALALAGDTDEILERVRCYRKDPAVPTRARAAASMLLEKEKIKSAQKVLDIYDSVFDVRSKAFFYHALSWKFAQAENFSSAVDNSNRALLLLPEMTDFYRRRVSIERNSGNLAEAISFSKKAIEKWPSYIDLQITLAECLVSDSQHDAASQVVDQVLIADDNNEKALSLKLSMVKHIYPKISLAEEIYQKLGNAASAEWYADALIEGGALIKAEAPLVGALSENGGNVRLLQKLASVYSKQQKWVKAADSLRKALTVAPSDFMLHVRLSQALNEIGEFQAAYDSIQRALEISPNHIDAETIAQNISLRLRESRPAATSRVRKSIWKKLFWLS